MQVYDPVAQSLLNVNKKNQNKTYLAFFLGSILYLLTNSFEKCSAKILSKSRPPNDASEALANICKKQK